MPKSVEYSAPEYSDDEPLQKPKKQNLIKEEKPEKKILLPSQMGYKPKEKFSINIPPPPNPSDRILVDKKPPQFHGRPPRHIKRNEKSGENFRESKYKKQAYEEASKKEKPAASDGTTKNEKSGITEKVKNKPMVSTNFRAVREGTDFVEDEVQIYYQSSQNAIRIESCAATIKTYKNLEKCSAVLEAHRFLDSKLIRNLNEKQIVKVRPIQAALMTAIFTYPHEHPNSSKADILATSKTGSGKTLAFLVPILQKAIERRGIQPNKDERLPQTLIFVNSTELAMTLFHVVKELLRGLRLKVVVMAASLNFIEETNFDIGICTNGRFQNHFGHTLTLGDKAVALDLSELEYIVIDEVDKMVSDSKFLSVLEKLKAEPKKPRIFGFSATIDADTTRIVRYSSVFQIKCGQHNVVPPNIKQFYWEVYHNSVSRVFRAGNGKAVVREPVKYSGPVHPFDTLFNALTEAPLLKGKRIMVFVKRTRIADLIAIRLRDYGIPAVSIHKRREDIQDSIDMYNKGLVDVAIVTQYFTRGIDTEVDVVINYDLPIIAADFIHRCGRTGRNGNTGIAITFIDFLDPENYNPEVIELIVKALAEKEDFVIPLFLQKRVADYKEWSLPEENT